MEKIKFYLEKYKLYIILITFMILFSFIIAYIVFNKNNNKEQIEQTEQVEITVDKKEDITEEKITKIKVDVKGRVKNKGVYELDSNSRVIDAINKAGGLKEDANTEYINLSKKLVDEMIIIIYSNDEINNFKKEEKEIIYIEYECICPDNINDACITNEDIVNTLDSKKESKTETKKENSTKIEESLKQNEESEKEENDLISINKATKEELMTLPGIGESKAENIIKYREEHGKFETLEDIKNVSGIGDSAYSKIKEYIKL